MNILTISAKFLGGQVEFGVGDHKQYTLANLWADVYMYCCSTMPNPSERFKVEVKLPWNGEYKLVGDDKELQQVFRMFKEKDYIPHSNNRGSIGGSQEDNSGYSVDGVEPTANEEASDDQQLSNASSFNWDNGCMGDEGTDDDEDGLSRYKHVKRGKPFKPADNGKVNLEVGSSSGTCTRSRVQVEETIAATLTQMSAPAYANASQSVGVVSSQLITSSAPLHSSQNASQSTQSNANLGKGNLHV
ncbi:hypothetical protein Q3G72_002522 [Acer saccharum]|nr:hypothetical protein Q3G72_002522 [Acer saccharum]